jgi:amino acid transporter
MYAITYGLAFAIAFNMGFQVWLFTNGVLSPTFAGLGLVYNNSALTNLGNWMVAGNGLFITGLILVALAILAVSLGVRTGSRVINVLFFFSLIVTVLWIVLGFAFSNSSFKSAYDTQFGSGQYQNVLNLGTQAGFSGFTFNGFQTLQVGFSLGYFSLYSNFQYPVWASGEIKRAQRVWVPYIAAIIVTGLLYTGLVGGLYNLMGATWIGAMSVASTTLSTSGHLPFSVPPTFTLFLTIMFKSNPFLVFLINAGLIAGSFTWFVVPYIAFSRLIFSMSFDRVLPKALADVNERFRVPIKALLITVVLVILWFSQYVYGLLWNSSYLSFSTVFFSVAAVAPAAWTVAAIVFALFPWLNRSLYERSMPQAFRRKVGLPIITWLAGFVAITQALAVYAYIVALSASAQLIAESAIAIIMVGSFLGYYVISTIRKGQGINLGYVFSEIPPE